VTSSRCRDWAACITATQSQPESTSETTGIFDWFVQAHEQRVQPRVPLPKLRVSSTVGGATRRCKAKSHPLKVVAAKPKLLILNFWRSTTLARLRCLPAQTLTSSNSFRSSNNMLRKNQILRSQVQRFSLRLVFLPYVRFTAKSSAPLGSACQSRLCSSARRLPQNRAVLASAPFGSAPLRRLTAPPCAPSLAIYETNIFIGL
jgi:hypothetical protein